METPHICISIYGSRGVAELWKMHSSQIYSPVFYAICKQNNPMVKKIVEDSGGEMWVDPSLSMETHMIPIEKYGDEIDLVVCPHEKLVIGGWRNKIEGLGVDTRFTFPTGEFALETSKILQRTIFPEYYNPRWNAFYPPKYDTSEIKEWLEELGGAEKSVFKPDRPATGKGVLVGGEHFFSESDLFEQIADFNQPFIIEEKLEVEESSSQIWYDGDIRHLKDLRYPETRDYKRAFDGDKGPNTGGMGCCRAKKMLLPWMSVDDYKSGLDLTIKTIRNTEKWALENDYDIGGMYPCMYYLAMAHPHKVFEGNIGRPGDPEDIVVLMTMKNDLIDFYRGLTEGSPPKLEFEKKAAVLVYVTPLAYPEKNLSAPDVTIDFDKLRNPEYNNPMYFPGDVELKENGKIHVRSSRSVAVVATADTIEEATALAQGGAEKIELSANPRGFMRHRTDIGSKAHLEKSKKHRRKLSTI